MNNKKAKELLLANVITGNAKSGGQKKLVDCYMNAIKSNFPLTETQIFDTVLNEYNGVNNEAFRKVVWEYGAVNIKQILTTLNQLLTLFIGDEKVIDKVIAPSFPYWDKDLITPHIMSFLFDLNRSFIPDEMTRSKESDNRFLSDCSIEIKRIKER